MSGFAPCATDQPNARRGHDRPGRLPGRRPGVVQTFRTLSLAALFAVAALFSACAGGGGYGGDPDVAGNPPPPPASTPPPPAAPGETPAPEVEIWTTGDRIRIADFRIDFAKMRNVLAVVGVFPDQWDRLATIPFPKIRELQFRGTVDTDTFEKIERGREDFQLNPNEIFRVSISEFDGGAYDFYAIIPRVRGFKDGIRWEMGMAGGGGIDRIVFPDRR